jgi:ubiquinone/menaquinone biosynthesis C-methylase UbiE
VRVFLPALVVAFALTAVGSASSQQNRPPARLFAPEELGLLEGPDRDDWQQPDRVMDQLGISDSARVADIGAGGGWFTIRLARRAPNGVVYAEDIQPLMIESIVRRVKREGLTNVKTILGTATDPHLPANANLDAVLMVDTYTQLGADSVPLLKRIAASLAPNGQLGIVDFKRDGAGGPGPPIEQRVSPDVVKAQAEAAGLRLLRHETFLRYQYLLIFVRSEVKGQKSEVSGR